MPPKASHARAKKTKNAAVVSIASTSDRARKGENGRMVVATIAMAAAAICINPSRADAKPARSPKGDNVRAVPNGLTSPIPKRKTIIGSK